MQQWQTATPSTKQALTKLERSFLSLLKLNSLEAHFEEYDWRSFLVERSFTEGETRHVGFILS